MIEGHLLEKYGKSKMDCLLWVLEYYHKQVGFFKKNPMKRSAAVYLLCVCLSFPVSRK